MSKCGLCEKKLITARAKYCYDCSKYYCEDCYWEHDDWVGGGGNHD